jgi:PAS domain S-box-containing protein
MERRLSRRTLPVRKHVSAVTQRPVIILEKNVTMLKEPEEPSGPADPRLSNVALTDEQKDMAALYASGVLTKEERERFEVELEQNRNLSSFTTELLELSSEILLNTLAERHRPRADSKARILQWVNAASSVDEIVSGLVIDPLESIVITDPEGRLAWANRAFSQMCGYGFEDLIGKKPGSVLQGKRTDPAEVAKIRRAMRSQTGCQVELLNYHKLGREYLVSIRIEPVRDRTGRVIAFVAVERELV